jgi:hypothetical protein
VITLLDREHQRALYAFGGGGSGAAMRLRGCAGWKEGTNSAAIGNVADGTVSRRAIVVPHEFIATQHGIAADLQGFGCSLCCRGTVWSEASWCDISVGPEADEAR